VHRWDWLDRNTWKYVEFQPTTKEGPFTPALTLTFAEKQLGGDTFVENTSSLKKPQYPVMALALYGSDTEILR
jgi:hypothetical protein